MLLRAPLTDGPGSLRGQRGPGKEGLAGSHPGWDHGHLLAGLAGQDSTAHVLQLRFEEEGAGLGSGSVLSAEGAREDAKEGEDQQMEVRGGGFVGAHLQCLLPSSSDAHIHN